MLQWGRWCTLVGLVAVVTTTCSNNHVNQTTQLQLAARFAESCEGTKQSPCDKVLAEINKTRIARDAALRSEDFYTAIEHSLEIAEKTEFLDLYRLSNSSQDADLSVLSGRYQAMRQLMGASRAATSKPETDSCPPTAERQCMRLISDLQKKQLMWRGLGGEALRTIDGIQLSLAINFDQQTLQLMQSDLGQKNDRAIRLLQERYDQLAAMIERLANSKVGSGVDIVCSAQTAEMCLGFEADLMKLKRDLEAAIIRGDVSATKAISWEIMYKTELLDVLNRGEAPESSAYAAVVSKYDRLRKLWEEQTTPVAIKPYTAREMLAVKKVFDDFGPLYIEESEIRRGENGEPVLRPNGVAERALTVALAKGSIPWTGFWYPTRTNLVSLQPLSPMASILEKFDHLSLALGEPVKSLQWESEFEQNRRLNPESLPEWEGLCDAWAMAALLRPEPTQALMLEGIRFSVSDLKGLLTKFYQNTDASHQISTVYGFRYDGTAATDGELQDPRPEAFHRIAEVMLLERQTAFGVDSDPGVEVWNKPLYQLSWSIEADPKIKNAYLVSAFPRLTRQISKISELPTAELMRHAGIVEAPAFEYRLYVDPAQDQGTRHKVIYGEWLGDSLDIHPDSIFIPDATKPPMPANLELRKARKVLETIFAKGQPVE